jgi:hypothetical protein
MDFFSGEPKSILLLVHDDTSLRDPDFFAIHHMQGYQILEIKNRDTRQRYKIAQKISDTNEILFLFICLFILLRNHDVKGQNIGSC